MLSFSPKTIAKEILSALPERSRKVLADRFGLNVKGESRTLEDIGREYGITRERIRQIESHGLLTARESSAYEEHSKHLEDLKKAVDQLGGIVAEHIVLDQLVKNEAERNHLLFLLTVGHQFDSRRETPDFRARWHTDVQLADAVERALGKLYESLGGVKLVSEEDFVQEFAKYLKEEGIKNRPADVLARWLIISKRIGKNPLGEWGAAHSPHVKLKNTRDFAYLTLKRHGSPMHYTEVASGIERLFGRKTHPATTHNELIKDNRFVLVGRGLYALREWGYEPGIVRDVIRGIIEREGPLTRSEIIDRVKRERYVKDATIAVNLQSPMFVRQSDGRYTLSK